MERKVNKVREEVFQFVICLSTAAPVFASPGHAPQASCSESATEEKTFSRRGRGCTYMLTVQEGFLSCCL